MATYKEIHGTSIEVLASDPSNPVLGQIWYNTTSQSLKGLGVSLTAAWATGGNLITAKQKSGAGTQTAALAFGPGTNFTEEYNGTSWSPGGNMGTARYGMGGAGTQTAGLAFGGYPFANSASTEEYNGSAWTAGGNLAVGRYALGGAGIQTAALGFGGFRYPTTPLPFPIHAVTEEYNGTAWTTGGNLGTGRETLAGAGTQTAGLAFGGGPPNTTATEEYDGSAWTAGGNLGTARYKLAGCGTQTAGLAFGGGTPTATAVTEKYDGTSWTTTTSMNTARLSLGGAGTQTAALAFGGGGTPTVTAVTEEFTIGPAPAIVTISGS